MTRPTRAAAFFDLDGTLLTITSLPRFLRYHWSRLGYPPTAFHAVARDLRLLAATVGRTEANRSYYRLLAGQDTAVVATHGSEWFGVEQRNGALFHPPVRAAFDRHADRGDLTVVVSGSFAACVDPIGEVLHPDLVVCSEPEIRAGRYTGTLDTPMIGAAKAAAARRVIAEHELDAAACYGYADHASDLPLLREVGNPVVVGADPVLTAYAERYDWPRLPGVPDVNPFSS